MKALILAAGYATRLYPLTKDKAKALLPVAGRPIIDYIMDQILTLDAVSEIHVVSNHRFINQFEGWAGRFRSDMPKQSNVQLVIHDDGSTSEADRLGAIGDIQFCIEAAGIDDDLLVIAGDNLFTYALSDAWREFEHDGADMILARRMPDADDLSRYAIAEIDPRGYVISLEEKPDRPKTDIAVFATYFYRRDTLPLIREYLDAGLPPDAPGHFPAWLYQRKPVRVYLFDGICIDIGTRESYDDVKTTFPPVRESRTTL
ncbi:MAG: nucleotidyltransferase family protein [Eubacteriales bacterium]|nr:nucleotidyltransferase family protein [Eubacteriales bacterium]MDD3866040.1 nucleotidyltransferase family protein [Eubacteriales bacterium]